MWPLSALADQKYLEALASDLGVPVALVEKDWYVVRALEVVNSINGQYGCKITFSGGTSLSKGFDLIKRFSEDIDFKVESAAALTNPIAITKVRNGLVRECLVPALTNAGFTPHGQIKTWGQKGIDSFFQLHLVYPKQFDLPVGFIPLVKLEMTFETPRKPAITNSIRSIVALGKNDPPEISAIACIDPVETAADKMSAFLWRAYMQKNKSMADRDGALVRHLHDLCALKKQVYAAGPAFFAEVRPLMAEGVQRTNEKNFTVENAVAAVSDSLVKDDVWRKLYDSYIQNVAYGPDSEKIGFDEALSNWQQITDELLKSTVDA